MIELRPRERTRSRAFAQLILVPILVSQAKPDEACAVGNDLLAGTRTLGSHLVARQIEGLHRLLAPYRRAPDVATFLRRLRDELRERCWLARPLPHIDTLPGAERRDF